MSKAYSRVRISLMTVALGLAADWSVSGPEIVPNEVAVDLPTASHSDVLLVFPTKPGDVPLAINQGSFCHCLRVYEVDNPAPARKQQNRR